LDYAGGNYWPEQITTTHDEDILEFLESHIWLWPLGQRVAGYSVLENTRITDAVAASLAIAAQNLFAAAQEKNARALGSAMTASFEAQIAMFPNMISPDITRTIEQIHEAHPSVLGHKLSGAGGGGYLVLFSEQSIPNTLQIRIRRAAS
jgi:galactokinase/mevalonate kinase-like predicted kinase